MARVDLHVHALMADALFFFRGRPGRGRLAARPGDIFRNQVSLQGWRDGGFGVAVATLYSPPVLHRGSGHLREILRQAAITCEFAAAHPERLELAQSPEEGQTQSAPAHSHVEPSPGSPIAQSTSSPHATKESAATGSMLNTAICRTVTRSIRTSLNVHILQTARRMDEVAPRSPDESPGESPPHPPRPMSSVNRRCQAAAR